MSASEKYDRYKEVFKKKHGHYPKGSDVVEWWEQNPEEKRKMCPNPVRLDKKVVDELKKKKTVINLF